MISKQYLSPQNWIDNIKVVTVVMFTTKMIGNALEILFHLISGRGNNLNKYRIWLQHEMDNICIYKRVL